ncbi:hypothetical protein M434DRAFT_229699 [Hypoxylon sp. CO27-5]|nr:hypothetical protein M434DRAFT_229699 [Hypoxylon sp. CO27-5]
MISQNFQSRNPKPKRLKGPFPTPPHPTNLQPAPRHLFLQPPKLVIIIIIPKYFFYLPAYIFLPTYQNSTPSLFFYVSSRRPAICIPPCRLSYRVARYQITISRHSSPFFLPRRVVVVTRTQDWTIEYSIVRQSRRLVIRT